VTRGFENQNFDAFMKCLCVEKEVQDMDWLCIFEMTTSIEN
jgi:hypothetical protein